MLRHPKVASALVLCVLTVACEGNPAALEAPTAALASIQPERPLSLTATASVTAVALAWPNSPNETYYELGRAPAPGSTVPVEGAYTLINSPAANVTAYNDTGLPPRTRYRYRLRACNGDGCSTWRYTYATTLAPPKPPTPAGFAAAWQGDGVGLTWTDGINETAYQIDRALAPTNSNISGLITFPDRPANSTSYGDGTVVQGLRYRYRIRACNLSVCSGYAIVYITTPPPPPPAVPGTFEGEVNIDGDVVLTWGDVSGQSQFKLQRALAPEGGPVGTTTNLPNQNGDVFTYTDGAALFNKRYRYRLQACNPGGCSSFAEVFVTTPVAPPPATVPTGFAADVDGDGNVGLEWVDSSNETRYQLERALSPSGTTISGANTIIATPAMNATGYDDAPERGKRYRYRIRACNGLGCSAYATIYVVVPPPPPPNPPEGLALSVDEAGDVLLTWADTDGETSYKLKRTVAPLGGPLGTSVNLPNQIANDTTYLDTSAGVGTRYRYQVQACNNGGCSLFTESFVVTPGPGIAPTNFVGTPEEDGDVVLTWNDSPNETRYEIERALAPTSSTISGNVSLATPGADATTHTDETSVIGTRYRYRIRACNGSVGCSAWVTIYVLVPAPAAPPIPATLVGTPDGPFAVDLTWGDTPNEDGYELDRAPAPGTTVPTAGAYANVLDADANQTTHTDETVVPNTRYRYRLRACNEVGCSGYRYAYVVTPTVPAPAIPGLFAGEAVGETIELQWADVATETEYRIERALAPLGGSISGNSQIAVLAPDLTEYTDTDVTAGTRYRYRLRACIGDTCSNYSTIYVSSSPGPSQFDIDLVYLTAVSPSIQAAFDAAEERWEEVIVGDVPDWGGNLPTACGNPAVDGGVDDIKIFVTVGPIDGEFGILGQAGPCFFRSYSDRRPITGGMTFDEADLAGMVEDGTLGDVILHEMGHVLGIGTTWNQAAPWTWTDLLKGTGASYDPYFDGAGANIGFDNVGGSGYIGTTVPVENSGGAGTIHAHWRESVFNTELMTGYAETVNMPMSEVTIRSVGDLGYTVDVTKAESYTLPSPGLRLDVSRKRSLEGDVRTGPIYVAP